MTFKKKQAYSGSRLKYLFLILFLFGFGSCVRAGDGLKHFVGDREKVGTRARVTTLNSEDDTDTTPPAVTQPEQFVFPFSLADSQISSMSVSSSDNMHIRFFAVGGQLKLIASYSGLVSLDESQGLLVLSPENPSNQRLHFKFQPEHSALAVGHQAQVKQKQLLLGSSKPIVFYLSLDGDKKEICFNLSGLEKEITVHKNFPENSNCS